MSEDAIIIIYVSQITSVIEHFSMCGVWVTIFFLNYISFVHFLVRMFSWFIRLLYRWYAKYIPLLLVFKLSHGVLSLQKLKFYFGYQLS